jgi:hypothetical protein
MYLLCIGGSFLEILNGPTLILLGIYTSISAKNEHELQGDSIS